MGKDITKLRWCKVTPSVGRDGFDKVNFTIINHQGEVFLEHKIGLKFFRQILNRDFGNVEARHFYNISERGKGIKFIFQVKEKDVRSCIILKKEGVNINSRMFRLCKSENKLNHYK